MRYRKGGLRRAGVLIGTLLFSLPSSVIVPAAHGQAVDFAVEPAEGSSLAETGGYFLLEAEPGDQVRQAVVLRNPSDSALDLELAAVDAVTGVFGGASYKLPNDEREATGAWITLEKRRIRLDPGSSQTVSFRVDVPADATSGEHLAGLSVWAVEEGEDTDDDSAVGIDVRSRRIIAVQVNTPGPSEPELEISGIDPAARPDGLYLEIAVANIGFGLTQGEGFVELPDEFFRREFNVDTFVPDTSIGYPVKWTDEPREGEYRAVVEIVYDDDKVARWEGTLTVGDPVLEELEDRGVAGVGGGFPRWMILAPAGIILLFGGTLFVRSRRGRAVVRGPQPRPWTAARVEATPQARPLPRNLSTPPPPPPPPPTSAPRGGPIPPPPRG